VTDLIVHIGLQKTGSTTLQDRVLKGISGYLGKTAKHESEKEKEADRLFKEFKRISRLPFDESGLSSTATYRARQLIQEVRRARPGIKRVIVSDEFFSTPAVGAGSNASTTSQSCLMPCCHACQIADFLSHFNKQALTDGQVKVVLVLRNQPDWLASMYSQISGHLAHASQSDFERRVDRLIKRRDHYVFWSEWVDNLNAALGQENICVLLMEDMNKTEFWERLFNFMQIDPANADDRIPTFAQKENVRNKGEDRWVLTSSSGNIKWAKMLANRHFPVNWAPRLRRTLRRASFGYNRVINLMSSGRDSEVKMTNEVREKILAYCRASNVDLKAQICRDDLGELGY